MASRSCPALSKNVGADLDWSAPSRFIQAIDLCCYRQWATNVDATFDPAFNSSVNRSGKGAIVSNPQGINCGAGGGGCSAKFAQNTPVTLTGTPDAGFRFSNWTGGCTGTATTCNLTITKDASVQAIFVKQ